jgi:DNA-binding transcriptional LysR family regulator
MPEIPDFNWDDLRFFLRAADTCTLAASARALGVEHTTIGRRISALERSLGAPLVVRGPKGLKLTVLGERLLPLVQEVERTVQAVGEMAVCERQRVRVAMPSGFASLFTERLPALYREHPGFTLETVSGSRPVDVKRGEVDLAIRLMAESDDSLIARPLGEVCWSLYASRAYLETRPVPEDPACLTGHDFIAFGSDIATLPASRWSEARAEHANVVMRANEVVTAVEAATAGLGVALLPCFLADSAPVLLRLTPEVLLRQPVSLLYSRETRHAEAVKVSIRFIIDVMKMNAARFAGR